jgi:chemotaxis protein MotA
MLDIATIIGIITSIGFISFGVLNVTDNFDMFFNISGLIIVVGGLFASIFLSFKFSSVFKVLYSVRTLFFLKNEKPFEVAKRFINYSKIVSEKGYIGLEPELNLLSKSAKFEKEMLELLVSNYKKEDIRSFIIIHAQEQIEVEEEDIRIFKTLEKRAPAFGMIGTIIGLIAMFYNMGSDISSIGPAMAVALTTTLYGVVLSSVLFGPIAEKMSINTEQKIIIYRILLDGMTYLHEKRNHVFMRDALNMHLIDSKQIK